MIYLGNVLKDMEDNLDIVECFSFEKNKCSFNGCCKLKPILYDATNLFIETLSKYNLADVID
ncbi:MAG: Rrf2 family transcriptional regulator [Romboutsia sp.]